MKSNTNKIFILIVVGIVLGVIFTLLTISSSNSNVDQGNNDEKLETYDETYER